jgi:hypothetical protein
LKQQQAPDLAGSGETLLVEVAAAMPVLPVGAVLAEPTHQVHLDLENANYLAHLDPERARSAVPT